MDPPPRSLLDRLADGPDSPAWAEFDRLYTPLLRSWLRPHFLQPADADDVVQDVLLVVSDKLPGFRPVRPESFRAWLRAILGYRLRTHWKQAGRRPAAGGFERLVCEMEDDQSDLARRLDDDHNRHVVRGLLEGVQPHFHPTTWQAFWRTVILEESATRVAADLRLTANAVFIARSRVLKRLRQEVVGLVDDV